MSSKSSIDKYEPIKLDTTILKIDIKSTGDLITKEYDLIPFHPNMSDMKDLSKYILTVPSTDTPRIQESHIMLGHIICELIEKRIYK